MTFGEKVKELRIKNNLSQRELGERMGGITQQTVAQYEKAIEQPKLITVRKIANALGVPVSNLVTNWNSFSPSEVFEDIADNIHEYDKINPRQETNNSRILKQFHSLNYIGQEKAIEQVALLTKIPEYRKSDTPDTEK